MLSYQHSFHAGNHADVIKHICLVALIKYLHKKPKPFFYLDTHAGNGAYNNMASSNKDVVLAQGVCDFVLAQQAHGAIADYANIVAPYLKKELCIGSPLIAAGAIECFSESFGRAIKANNLQLSEMHPQAFDDLKQWMSKSDFSIHQRDGFELLHALMPPKPNRGVVLIDPPYEQAQEYETVLNAVSKSIAKWPQGVFAVWFPLLSPQRLDRKTGERADNPKSGLSESMIKRLAAVAKQHKLGALELRFAPHLPSEKIGMYGSGMFVINPPWQFAQMMQTELNPLFTKFSEDSCLASSFVKTWCESE